MREIHEGKSYKHFKGTVYKVLHIGYDTEVTDSNGEPRKLVIYSTCHDNKVWVRPYDMFVDKVDLEKYPNSTQEYRFEEVD